MADRQAALIAAAFLAGPVIPKSIVQDRPVDAASAVTRMAELLLPWLEAEQSLAGVAGQCDSSQRLP